VFVEARIYEQALTPPVSPSAGDRRRPKRWRPRARQAPGEAPDRPGDSADVE